MPNEYASACSKSILNRTNSTIPLDPEGFVISIDTVPEELSTVSSVTPTKSVSTKAQDYLQNFWLLKQLLLH